MKVLAFIILLSINLPSFAGLFQHNAKWSKRIISACWKSNNKKNEFSSEFRRLVEHTIKMNYTQSSVGLEFNFFNIIDNKCDVIIHGSFIEGPNQSNASIGDGNLPKPISFFIKPYVHLKVDKREHPNLKLNLNQRVELSALHEFGHLAGLRHEHIISKGDPFCNGILSFEKIGSGTEQYSEYDPFSIMSYCLEIQLLGSGPKLDGFLASYFVNELYGINKLQEIQFVKSNNFKFEIIDSNFEINFSIKLSSGDQHTLRCAYKDDYDKTICNSQFKIYFNSI